MLLIGSLFSFFIAIVAFLAIKRKWPFRFKTKATEEAWHTKNDKAFKIMAVILFIVGVIQLIRGIIEMRQYFGR